MTDHLMNRAIDREVAKPSEEKSRAELTKEYSDGQLRSAGDRYGWAAIEAHEAARQALQKSPQTQPSQAQQPDQGPQKQLAQAQQRDVGPSR